MIVISRITYISIQIVILRNNRRERMKLFKVTERKRGSVISFTRDIEFIQFEQLL